jgi:hypothetical protein
LVQKAFFNDHFSIIVLSAHLVDFLVLDSALFKLSAQVHHLAGATLTAQIIFQPSFHLIEDDGGILSVCELVVFESECQLRFFAIYDSDCKVDFDGPLRDWTAWQRIRELGHEMELVVSLVLKSSKKHEACGPQRDEFVDNRDAFGFHSIFESNYSGFEFQILLDSNLIIKCLYNYRTLRHVPSSKWASARSTTDLLSATLCRRASPFALPVSCLADSTAKR